MVDIKKMVFVAALAMAGSSAMAQSGGPYEITAWTIDGGGVVNATGGVYSLSGTVGQPDAGPIQTGGTFELAGGFWPAAIETVGCPADLAAPFGVLNFFDVSTYISLYNANDPGADLAAPLGVLNFFDVAAFISAYNAGCP
ncbi:MAG: GC-type dockerin domain-anchored protein [Phycisphaerales bacterium]